MYINPQYYGHVYLSHVAAGNCLMSYDDFGGFTTEGENNTYIKEDRNQRCDYT